jgi:hypothetical protein
VPFRYRLIMLRHQNIRKYDGTLVALEMCLARFPWIIKTEGDRGAFIARDPAPNDPDVHPVREPEPQPDTPEPDPGDEPERIDPVRTLELSDSRGA